ncbi:MAG TPA: ABC transporter permease [Rhizomicrobium sp.]|nr:ABC transporter permease [Rhizomicrobium sp.]
MIGLAIAYLKRRWGQALLATLVAMLGIAALLVTFAGFEALPPAAERAWGGADVVIGPKGSPLDLVLCCALHVSDPQGLISEKEAMGFARNPLVRAAAPIALGDNIDGWRIVGTTQELLSVYRAEVARGRSWNRPMEAVLGAQAANALGLGIGDIFVGAHGLSAGGEQHSQFPYRVVGILAPTGSVLDRLVLCDIETIRYIHKRHAEDDAAETGVRQTYVNLPDAATAIVASYKSPVAMMLVPRLVNANEALTAASPSLEIARLMSYARPLTYAVLAVGMLMIAIAAATAATALLATMNVRTKDLALLRVLGASPARLALVAFSEAGIIAVCALILGALLAVGMLAALSHFLALRTGVVLQPQFSSGLLAAVIAGAFGVAALAAALPAFRAASTPIEEVLKS